MPKRRRQAKIPTPAWGEPHRSALGSRLLGRSPKFYGTVLISLLVVVALGIVAYAFVSDYVEDQRRPGSTALQVGDTRFKLDYFSDRLKIYVDQFSGQDTEAALPNAALPAVSDILIREEILRRFASEFDISASDEEIRSGIAARLALDPDSPTFDVAFQQEVVRTGLTEDEYLQIAEAAVLDTKLADHFKAAVPASVESVRYRQILVGTDARAQELRKEIEDGGDFVALAKDNSLDSGTKDAGGEVGWVPRGSLDESSEELVFALEPGELTTLPLPQGVIVLEMEEKSADQAVSDGQKGILTQRAFGDWVKEKVDSLSIVNNMDLTDGDAEKIQWAVNRAYQS